MAGDNTRTKKADEGKNSQPPGTAPDESIKGHVLPIQKGGETSYKGMLIAINEVLTEIPELRKRVKGTLDEFRNAELMQMLQVDGVKLDQLMQGVKKADASKDGDSAVKCFEEMSEIVTRVDIASNLRSSPIRYEIMNLNEAQEAFEKMAGLVVEQRQKPVLDENAYTSLRNNYSDLERIEESLKRRKEEGDFEAAMEHVNEFRHVKVNVNSLDGAIEKARAREVELGILRTQANDELKFAQELIAKCNELIEWKEGPFPRGCKDAIQSRFDDLAERDEMATKLIDKDNYQGALCALARYHGNAKPREESEQLPEMKRQLEAIEGQLKELAEVENETAPKPQEEGKKVPAPSPVKETATPSETKASKKMHAIDKVVIVGPSGAGKEEYLDKIAERQFKGYLKTFGTEVGKHIVEEKTVGDVKLKLDIMLWDVTGAEKFRSLWEPHNKGARGAILAVSAEDQDIVNTAKGWTQRIREKDSELPIVIIVTKSDLVEKSELDGRVENLMKAFPDMPIFPTSVKTGENLDASFDALVRKIAEFHLKNS